MATYQLTVDLDWTVGEGSPGTNSWFFREVGSGPLGDVSQATDALAVFYQTLANWVPQSVTMHTDGVWTILPGSSGTEIKDTDGWSMPGASSSGYLPHGTCILLDRDSAGGGRKGKGRVFLGPVAINALEGNGTVVETVRQALADSANTNLTPGGTGDGAFVVHSRATGTSRDIVNFSVPNNFGLLRSRRD